MIFEVLMQNKVIMRLDIENNFDDFFKLDGLQIYNGNFLLGEYETSKRAKQIYDELFTAWVTGDKSFLMPEE